MASLITIYWRDIPSQVMAKAGRNRARQKLSARFQEAIDRAAMRAKKIDMDAYLEDWVRKSEPVDGDLDELAKAHAEQIEKDYDDARLDALIRNKGVDPDAPEPSPEPSNDAA